MQVHEAVEGFLLDCQVRGLSERTIEWYRQKLSYLADWLQEQKVVSLERVTTLHLRTFVQQVQQTDAHANNPKKPTLSGRKVSAFTLKGYTQTMKTLFRWCVAEGLLEKDPSARLARPKLPRYLIPTLSVEQIEALMGACDSTTAIGFRDQLILLLLLDTGVRVSELCGLKLRDVHEDYIVVTGKGSKQREIGISPILSKYLWKYVRLYRKPVDSAQQQLLLSYRGLPLAVETVDDILAEIRSRAGLNGVRVSPHVFRHTFARTYLAKGGDVYKLSRLMGHTGVEVTQIYLKDVQAAEARQGQADLSPLESLDIGKRKRGHWRGFQGKKSREAGD
ncbi:MAG TPA: tyrosine-type recombinase/integrase [Ktedonobacterales bacterium]|nr:tyrosine-type recombinase/integrase [Ktedonobacterales bacterium]